MDCEQEIIDLTKKLIEFKTTPDNEDEINKCMDFIEGYFMPHNVHVKRYQQKNVMPCMVITFNGRRESKFFLNGHIDVVDADEALFKPKIKGTKLLGRGAVDMKSAVATYMVLMKNLSALEKRPSLGLMIVSDEEVGGVQGTQFLLDKRGYKCDFAITGESSLFNVEILHKETLALKVITHGKNSHASRPWRGDNALDKLFDIYKQLTKKYNKATKNRKWNATCVLTNVKAIGPSNTVPDIAEGVFDIRLTEKYDSKEIIKFVKSMGADTEVLLHGGMLNTSKDNPYVQSLKGITHDILKKTIRYTKSCGSSDTRYFTEKKIPAVNFGPTGGRHHTNDEYVRHKLLIKYYQILERFMLENGLL